MITEEMITDFKSHNWLMWDFCMKHDCGAEVYLELSQRYGIGAKDQTSMVDADAFVAGFVHDELGGDLSKLEHCSLLRSDCKTPFYKSGATAIGDLNDVLLSKIAQLVCLERSAFSLDRLVYVRIFTTPKLFGKAMPKGFPALRKAGASEGLIEKGCKLADLRYTLGNVVALPQEFCRTWWNKFPDRFDLFLEGLLKGLDDVENSTFRQLIQENQNLFAGGKSAFLHRHFLQDFSLNMGEAYAMQPFAKEDVNGDAEAYLQSAEQFLDGAIKVITCRAKGIVDCLRMALKDVAPSYGLTL